MQAKCRETGEIAAIKKVLQDKRYKNREMQIMHMLDHPNIVALKHWFFSTMDKEVLYLNLVLEYVPETVNSIISRLSKLRPFMASSRLANSGGVRSLRTINMLKRPVISVDWIDRDMLDMRIRDNKFDVDDEKVS